MSENKGNNKSKEGKNNLFKIIIIVLLALILLGGAVAATYYFVKDKGTVPDNNTTEKEIEIDETMFSLDDFLVNLADEKGKRYFKVKIYLGYEKNEKLATELEEKKPKLRDLANSVLRAKKSSEVNAAGEEALKAELLIKLNSVLNKGKLRSIYFYDILVQ